MAEQDRPDDTRTDPSRRYVTPETAAMLNAMRASGRTGDKRPWWLSWWVPVLGTALGVLLLLMIVV